MNILTKNYKGDQIPVGTLVQNLRWCPGNNIPYAHA